MPSKKKKYNARFPAGRIKKIMQTDEEVGKVAQAVPVIISRTLELFVESLLTKTMQITLAKSAKTLSPSHMKQCILSESRFDFLKDLVKSLPDSAPCDEEGSTGMPPVHSDKPLSQHVPPILQTDRLIVPISLLERKSNPLSTEFEARLVPTPTSPSLEAPATEAVVCQNSETPVPAAPLSVNPNFYTETQEYQTVSSSYHVPATRPASPPALVVDEDYDT